MERSEILTTMSALKLYGMKSLDRLTHHCDIVDTGSESWRFKNRI